MNIRERIELELYRNIGDLNPMQVSENILTILQGYAKPLAEALRDIKLEHGDHANESPEYIDDLFLQVLRGKI